MAGVVVAVALAFYGSRGPRERTWAVLGLAFGLMAAFLVTGGYPTSHHDYDWGVNKK